MNNELIPSKQERPSFSKDYGINPHQETGLLSWDWVCERMKNARNYWVSSTQANGKPHVAPVWGVFSDNALFFGTSQNSRKAKNLLHNTAAIIHLESGDETVIFEGEAEPVKDLLTLSKISTLYGQKYPGYQPPPEFEPGTILFVVKPTTVFAWTEADFLNTPTRWRFI